MAPYAGPPSYGPVPPRWGFPTVTWRTGHLQDADSGRRSPARLLTVAGIAAAATALVALVAAGAEAWRFSMMLAGRTKVLSGQDVATSDRLVWSASWTVMLLALITVALAVPALVRTHRFAELRAGLAPSKPPAMVLARLLTPGWNVYGAGQILAEADFRLAADPDGPDSRQRPRVSHLVLAWWLAWILNSVLVLVTLLRAFGGSLQAIADTVELHIAVDLTGAAVAGLGALLLFRFARRVTGRRSELAGWQVRAPEPTRKLAPAEPA